MLIQQDGRMLTFALLVAVVILLARQEKLLGRVIDLESRMMAGDGSAVREPAEASLRRPASEAETAGTAWTPAAPASAPATRVEVPVEPVYADTAAGPAQAETAAASPSAAEPEEAGVADASSPPEPEWLQSPPPAWTPPAWWSKLERQIVENWTGIVGAVVLVAGITFVGGYTGLRMSPFYRSLGMAGAGVALMGAARFVERMRGWAVLGQWLTSAGAAVFLFACFGSSAIPGLRWLEGLAPSLGVLLVGITVNLVVAYRARTETLSALHVVLGLVPFLLVPQSGVTLGVATVVAAAGLAMGLRMDWDLQALVVLATTAAVHAVWITGVPGTDPTSALFRFGGPAAALLVAALALASHYRPGRSEAPVAPIPMTLHLAAWTLGAASIFLYSGSTPVRGVLLLLAAGAALALGRLARDRGIRWVYLTDVLVAEGLATAALVAFDPWIYHWLAIPALVYGLALAAHQLAVRAGEPFLERVGIPVIHVTGGILALSGVVVLDPGGPWAIQHAAVLLVTTGAGAGYLLNMNVHQPGQTARMGIGVGVLASVGMIQVHGADWEILLGSGVGVALLASARLTGAGPLTVAGWIALLAAHLSGWFGILEAGGATATGQAWIYLPLLLGGVSAWHLVSHEDGFPRLRRGTAHLLGVTLVLAVITLLNGTAFGAPSAGWMAISVLMLVIADRWARDAEPLVEVAAIHLGLAAIGIAQVAVAHLATVRGPLTLQLEATALAGFLFWWWYRPGKSTLRTPAWRWVQPLSLEASLGLSAAVLLAEADVSWRAPLWGLVAVILVPLGGRGPRESRLRLYAIGFFWLSLLGLVVAGGRGGMHALLLLEALAIQVFFLAWASRRLQLEEIAFPEPLQWLDGPVGRMGKALPALLYYPFFLALAFALFWRFDSALLTLLWAGEAFVVFAVSLYLRESHFRYMALAALAAVVARLILVDLSESNLGVRGAVFMGVGLLMLGMNSLYNRYRSRYS